ncbi:MAG: transcription antitermination factor NusB [Bdellovibrionota bacterium]
MRRQSREIALQILFQTEYAPQITFDQALSLLDDKKAYENTDDKTNAIIKYADDIITGVHAKKEIIDQKIQEASRHWKIERMGGVDRNILRLAVFEMFHAKEMIEPKIAINEAIEIAKTFGSQESASFVNGLLDQIVRNARG